MKIKEVTYGRTSTKNFQSKRADVTIELEKGDTFEGAIARAHVLVAKALDETPSQEEVAKAREILALAGERT